MSTMQGEGIGSTPKTRKTTVPKPFHFLSDERAKEHNHNGTDIQGGAGAGHESDIFLAQSADILRKVLRSDTDVNGSPRYRPKSKLIMPQASDLYRSKGKATVNSRDDLDAPSPPSGEKKRSPGSPRRESKLVAPRRLYLSAKKQHNASNVGQNSSDVTLAQSEEFLRKGLRSNSEVASSSVAHKRIAVVRGDNRVSLITRPSSPKFHEVHTRELPKSSEELEQQMLEELKSKPFKARPLPSFITKNKERGHHEDSKVISRRSTTEPEPFHFASEDRAFENSSYHKIPSQEERDLIECQKKFKARPMPDLSQRSPVIVAKNVKSPTKVPGPFHLCSDERPEHQHLASTSPSSPEESLSNKPFRARPLPKTTYNSPSPRHLKPGHTSNTAETKGMVSDQCSLRIANDKSIAEKRRKDLEAEKLRRQKLEAIQPFSLQSTARHEEYLRLQAERRKKEEEEEKKLSRFCARPFRPPTNAPNRQKTNDNSEKESTNPSSKQSKARSKRQRVKVRIGTSSTKDEAILERGRTSNRYFDSGSFQSCLALYLFLCVFRIMNTFAVRSYFDPDEFWQTLEPAYCKVFVAGEDTCPGLTWEWTRRAESSGSNVDLLTNSMHGPVRSYLSVLPTYAFYWVANKYNWDTHWLVSRGPAILNAVTVAAPVDFAVWYSAGWMEPSLDSGGRRALCAWCLLCSVTSWFNGYSLVRTFSNSQETALVSTALALVSPEFLGNFNARFRTFRGSLAFIIGGLSVAIRFTSLAAFVPIGLMLASRHQKFFTRIMFLVFPCAVMGILGLAIALAIDRIFYDFWTVPFIGNFHFNAVQGLAEIYGSHPWHWYLLSGIPAVSGLLLPFVIASLFTYPQGATFGERNLWIVIFTYTFVLSLSGHKEFRFIHPILPLVCLLSGRRVQSVSRAAGRIGSFVLLLVFVVGNLVAVLYLGLFHQAAPVMVNSKIVDVAQLIATETPSSLHFRIYYLTGGCHTTPLHSHLHSPPLSFTTWSLDCSPECRSDPEQTCEADAFALDPVDFINSSICGSALKIRTEDKMLEEEDIGAKGEEIKSEEESEASCTEEDALGCRPAPDFVVTFASYLDKIGGHLERLGLIEVGHYPHNINGVKLGATELGDDFGKPNYRRLSIFSSLVEVSVEDMVVFAKHEDLPTVSRSDA